MEGPLASVDSNARVMEYLMDTWGQLYFDAY